MKIYLISCLVLFLSQPVFANYEVKITTEEAFCQVDSCHSETSQRHEELIQVPEGQKSYTWKKEVYFQNRKHTYLVDFDLLEDGTYFVYSSIYLYSELSDTSIPSSAGAVVKDLNSSFMTQLQGPQNIENSKFWTSMIIVSDKTWTKPTKASRLNY